MQRKSILVVAAMVAGLALGVVVAPTLRSTVASAQAQPAAANSLWSLFLDKLAGSLNIQRSALDSAITSAGNSTADTAAQQGTLTQAQADALKARIAAGDLGALLGGRGGAGDFGGGASLRNVKQPMIDAAAKALNITSAELTTQLRSGQTLAQLAQAHNTTEQAVVSAALAAAKTQLDQSVAAGSLTQAQADTIYAQLQQQGAQLFTPRMRGNGGRGAPSTPAAPAAPQDSSTSSQTTY